MAEETSHSEIQELLGAYALGAVDESERAIIEAHLETCDSCRTELAEHSRLAETLRRHGARVSPLASENGANTSEALRPAGAAVRRLRRWAASIAAMIVVLIFGGLLLRDEIRFNDLEAALARGELRDRAQLAMSDPAAVLTTLHSSDDDPVLTVVSGPGGEAYALPSALPVLPAGETYQLWRVENGEEIPAVALGRDPDLVRFLLVSGTTGFVLTVEDEPAPGRPTLPAVATADIAS